MPTRPALLRILTALLALAGLSPSARAQVDGALDTSFWFDGKAVLDSPPDTYKSVGALVVSPEGELVAVGTRYDSVMGQTVFWAVLDDTGMGTPCVASAPGGWTNAFASAAAFDDQDRLVIAGGATFGSAGQEGMALRYLYPACDLDEGFNLDGIYRTNFANSTVSFRDLAFDSNSCVVLAGTRSETGLTGLVVRLAPTGLLDLSFNGNGLFELAPGSSSALNALAVQPDDRIVAAGNIGTGVNEDMLVIRIDPIGDLDGTFAGDGIQTVDFGSADFGNAMTIDPSTGRILVAGENLHESAVARLEPNGSPDSSFDGDGKWSDSVRALETAREIHLESDGKIFVVSDSRDAEAGSNVDFVVYRLLSNAQRDNSFDGNGVRAVAFDEGGNLGDYPASATLHAGKLVVAGQASSGSGAANVAVAARLWIALIFADGFERGSSGGWSSAVGAP